MALTPPVSVADFKAQFDRDFTYGVGLETVRDTDISKAFSNALVVINPCLWDSNSEGLAFMYAAAHFLVIAIQSAGGLIPFPGNRGAHNRSDGVTISKSVGSVSTTFNAPPAFVQQHAGLLPFWETEYGKQYCQMLGPRLIGVVLVVAGEIDPQVAPDTGTLH